MAKTTRASKSTKTTTKKKTNKAGLLSLPQFNRPVQLLAFAAIFGVLGLLLNYFVNARPNIPSENQAVFVYRAGHGHTIYEADFSDSEYPIALYEDGLLVCGQEEHHAEPRQARLSKAEIKEFVQQAKVQGFENLEANKHYHDDSGLVDPVELATILYLYDGQGKAAYYTSGEKPAGFAGVEQFAKSYCETHAKDELVTEEYIVESVPTEERAAKVAPERRPALEASAKAQLKTIERPEFGPAVRNTQDESLLQTKKVSKQTAQSLLKGLGGNKNGRVEHEGKNYDVRVSPVIPEYHLRDVQKDEEETAKKGGKVHAGAARTVEFVWFYPSDQALQSNASTNLANTSIAVRSWYKSKINENMIHGGNRVLRGAKTTAQYETCPSGKTCADKLLAAHYNVQAELQRTDAQVVVLFQSSLNKCNGWGSGGGGSANLGDNQAGSATFGQGTVNMTGCNWVDGRERVTAHELGHGLGSGHWCSNYNVLATSSCSTPANSLGTALLNSTQKTTWRNNSWFFSASPGHLLAGEQMFGDAILRSPQGKYRLVMQQSDGNLVVYEAATGKAIWNSRTGGYPGSKTVFQTSGNLIVRKTNGTVCQSQSGGKSGSRLVMQDDGNLVIYTSSNTAIWSSRYNTWYC